MKPLLQRRSRLDWPYPPRYALGGRTGGDALGGRAGGTRLGDTLGYWTAHAGKGR